MALVPLQQENGGVIRPTPFGDQGDAFDTEGFTPFGSSGGFLQSGISAPRRFLRPASGRRRIPRPKGEETQNPPRSDSVGTPFGPGGPSKRSFTNPRGMFTNTRGTFVDSPSRFNRGNKGGRRLTF